MAEEILAAAFANRENLTALVRGEVDVAVSRLGLVPAADLEGARDEVARLRAEVSRLREATTAAVQGAQVPDGRPQGWLRPRSPRAHRKPPRRDQAGRDAPPRVQEGRLAHHAGTQCSKAAVAVGGEVRTPGAEKAAATVRGEARPPAVGAPTVSSEPVTAPGTPFAEAVTAEPAGGTSPSQDAEAMTATGSGGTRETATKKVATARKKAAAAKATARKSAPAKPAAARTAAAATPAPAAPAPTSDSGAGSDNGAASGLPAAAPTPAAENTAAAGTSVSARTSTRKSAVTTPTGKTPARKTAAKSATVKRTAAKSATAEKAAAKSATAKRTAAKSAACEEDGDEEDGDEADRDEEDRILGSVRPDRGPPLQRAPARSRQQAQRGRWQRTGHRMSERPFMPKPGPPSGSGPDRRWVWVLDSGLLRVRHGPWRPSGGTAVRPPRGWRRQRARPGSTDSAAGEARRAAGGAAHPAARGRLAAGGPGQPEGIGMEPGATPEHRRRVTRTRADESGRAARRAPGGPVPVGTPPGMLSWTARWTSSTPCRGSRWTATSRSASRCTARCRRAWLTSGASERYLPPARRRARAPRSGAFAWAGPRAGRLRARAAGRTGRGQVGHPRGRGAGPQRHRRCGDAG